MSDHHIFTAGQSGVNLLVFGAVHGNEKCGTKAIMRVIKEIEDGTITLQRGSVTFVPIANPRAYEAHVRYIDENLNRIFFKDYNGESYEASLVGELVRMIDGCDYLLDIHSYSYGKGPFAFQDKESTEFDRFAASFGINPVLTGWKKLHGDNGPQTSNDYAFSVGKSAITVECGQHDDPEAIDIAYNAILNALSYLEIMPPRKDRENKKGHKVRLMTQVIKDEEGTMAKHWHNMDPIKKGELIATTESGKELKAPHDGYIIMPHHAQKIGEEWYYTAVTA